MKVTKINLRQTIMGTSAFPSNKSEPKRKKLFVFFTQAIIVIYN